MNNIQTLQTLFEQAVQKIDSENIEFWFARDLQTLLGYERWENFKTAINRALEACKHSGQLPSDHFRGVTKMVTLGSGSQREIEDLMLTRYACYLIAQNGDPRKPEIAFAQSYFAVQTRKQELIEQRMQVQSRLEARERLRTSEKILSQNIYERGVDEKGFGRIRSHGDHALFGYTTQQMKERSQKNSPSCGFSTNINHCC
ncbi:DNA-damage-inducible protein D [Avibacterium gallinarum]|uniref:DNA-damage-inducible protein D n=1 Tax=Avibacterium gallinarum TaxID=755 RepID=A0A379BYY0_AVIGA|nr:DNA damage-inducible protein D [Avibacterium gallinarum]SUB54110.1 DNA-damage-inducible protein D [Avibacterium gallinarum]